MKKLMLIVSLLLILAAMLPFTNRINKEFVNQNNFIVATDPINDKILNEYNFKIRVDIDKRELHVLQKIKWHNNSQKKLDELFISFPLNAFSNSNTEFSKNLILENENKTHYDVKQLLINNQNVNIEFIKTETSNNFDSTVAKIKLKNPIQVNDSIILTFSYSAKIPKSLLNFGYAPGDNFLVFDNFYPFIFPFIDTVHVKNQMHTYARPLKEFANISAVINFPSEYKIISNAYIVDEKVNKQTIDISLRIENSLDFTFLLCREMISQKFEYLGESGSKVEVGVNLRESRESYFPRVKTAVINSLNFLEKHIGKFPFDKIEIVDVIPSSNSQDVSLPGMIRINIDLFSLENLRKIEQDISFQLTKQYFGCSVVVNENISKMITEGISAYLRDKSYHEFYQNPYSYFDFVHYFPVYGLNILSYNEIPIIYTVTGIQYPVEFRNIGLYYKNSSFLSFTDSTCKINNSIENKVVNEIKPKLFLMTLENMIGEKRLLNGLKKFYNENKNRIIERKAFDDLISELCKDNAFVRNIFYQDEIIDNKIISLQKLSPDKYELRVEKSNAVEMPIDIYIHTSKGIIKKTWNNSKKVETIIFTSKNEVYSAEIDPQRKFISDVNYANNSYVIFEQYWGSFSIAMRTYFWFQNALLIMGSVG